MSRPPGEKKVRLSQQSAFASPHTFGNPDTEHVDSHGRGNFENAVYEINMQLREKKNQNWLKATIAVDITRTGLITFVTTVVTNLHQAIRANIENTNGLPPGASCNACRTPNVLRCRTPGFCMGPLFLNPCSMHKIIKFRKCPANICDDFASGIKDYHRFTGPSWNNSNANDWCSNPWEVAKCFFPPDGYLNVHTAEHTDINGIINLIINCTFFDNYFTEDLSQKCNICTKVRDVGRKLRHSPSLMISDSELFECIDTLKTILQDSKHLASDQSANGALAKLTLLENCQLSVTTEGTIDLFRKTTSITSEMLNAEKVLQNNMDDLKALEQHIQTVADKAVRSIQRGSREYCLEVYSLKSAALKEDLQTHYLENFSSLDLGPMFQTNSPNLVEMYMPPILSKSTVDTSDASIRVDSKMVRSEIKDLDEVFQNMGKHAKRIYITAKAGVGKSAFCKFIVRLWCALQKNNDDDVAKLKSRGAGTYLNSCKELKKVQYVFYARLDQSRSRLCEMDDIVFHQVVKRLSRSEQYDMKFLQKILDEKRCLMIFDGLDEWIHPDVEKYLCFEKDTDTPHAKGRDKCTVMMSSRHWKLRLKQMHSKESNVCVEIEELDGTKVRPLVEKAFSLLVGDSKASKPIDEFFKMLETKGLNHLLCNTLVALQLLPLWYNGNTLGDSKCKVYCGVLETMLVNVLDKNIHLQYNVAEDIQHSETIKCFQTRQHCLRLQESIRSLGEIAFYSLFHVEELEAQIKGNLTRSICTRKTEEFGLLTGLLLKTQLHSCSLYPLYEYSFLHKTYQELLACVYIASIPHDSETHEHLVEIIKSSSETLSFDMMLFLSGMHEPCAKDMFEIYCDLQTTRLCQRSNIEHSAVQEFHENCLSINEAMEADNKLGKTAMNMRSLLLGGYNYSSTIFNDLSFLSVIIQNEDINVENVQTIVENCKNKVVYVCIRNKCETDHDIPSPIAPEIISSCINLHTLVLRNLSFLGELDISSCRSLSCLDLSLPGEGDPVSLVLSPNKLKRCTINSQYLDVSSVVSITCTCQFESELLEHLVVCNVKFMTELCLLNCKQLQRLCLVNVDTKDIITRIENRNVEQFDLGGYTDEAVMTSALQSLQDSKCLKSIAIWYFNDAMSTRLNRTLRSLSYIKEIHFFLSDTPLMQLHIPMSVRQLTFNSIIISAECLMKMITYSRDNLKGVHIYLKRCYVLQSNSTTIETIVREIKTCSRCVLNDELLIPEDEIKEHRVVGKINVSQLDFKIKSWFPDMERNRLREMTTTCVPSFLTLETHVVI